MLQLVRRPVGQGQAVVPGQGLDLVVIVVDGLPTGLDVEPVGERQMEGVYSAPDPVAGLEDDHIPTAGAEGQCGGESREPCTHYGNPPQ